jgi:N-acetylmuramoyl-L-alanine amidase
MNLREMLIPKDALARPGALLKEVTSITIHWIGPYPKQAVETPREWWIKGPSGLGMDASAHFIVKDDDVLQCLPTTEVAWHCGCSGNYTSLGIEVVPSDMEGQFSAASIRSLKALLKTLPNVELKRHFDWTGKDCPRYYTPLAMSGDARWAELKQYLLEA